MNGFLEATYEGNGLLRLKQSLKGLRPQSEVRVIVMPPASGPFVVEDIGIAGLRDELKTFETQYNMPSSEFYRRFRQGEMGDAGDFVIWAGLYEMYLRLSLDEAEN